MPMIIPFIPAIVAAAIPTISAIALAAITVASAVASAALAAQAARKAARKARDQYNASLVDRSSLVRGTTEGRDIALGRVRKSGQLAYIGTSGATRNKLTMVIAVAGHEIDAFEKIFFNDIEVSIDGSGNTLTAPYFTTRETEQSASTIATVAGSASFTLPSNYTVGSVRVTASLGGDAGQLDLLVSVSGLTATVTNAEIQVGTVLTWVWTYPAGSSWANVRFYTGTDTQTADATMIASLPGVWTANHRLRGVAYAIVDLYYNEDVYTSGVPNVSFQIRGAKCFDPRTSTTVWTENPALHMRYLALSPLAGKLTAAQIDDASIIAAANACDALSTYTIEGGALEDRLTFRSSYVFTSGSRPKDGLDDLAQAMAGKWLFANNRLKVKAGVYTSPVMTLTEDDFSGVGDVQVQPGVPREEMINIVTATMLDDRADYKLVDMPAVRAQAYIDADGAELPLEMQFEAVAYVPQAQHVASIVMRDSRQSLTVVASFKMRAYPIEVLDTVAITSARYGWSAKAFEVLSRRWTIDGMIELTLKETAASIYSLYASFQVVDIAPNTNLPRPWEVPILTGLALANITSITDGVPQPRLSVTWDQSTSEGVLQGGSIEIAYLRTDAIQSTGVNDWPSARVAGRATGLVLSGLIEGLVYAVKIRAFNGIARSPWSTLRTIRVSQYAVDYLDLANRPRNYRVASTGLSATTQPIAPGFYNGDTGATIYGASMYNVVTILRSTRVITAHGSYNVRDFPVQRTALVSLLNGFGSDRIVILYTQDEPRDGRLLDGMLEAMLRHGASRAVFGSPQFAFRGAYVLIAIGACGEGNGFEAYQGAAASDANAWVDVAFAVTARGDLLVTGQGATPRTLADYSYTGSLDATSDVSLVAKGTGMTLVGNVATHTTATDWDGGVYSRDSYTGGAYASARVIAPTAMLGLNTDPLGSASFATLDYALYAESTGSALAIFESGSSVGSFGTWAVGDVLAVTYDGFTVRYFKNGSLLYSRAASPNLRLFFDSSFALAGSQLSNIQFGPLSSVANIATGQIAAGAATDVYSGFLVGPVSVGSSGPLGQGFAIVSFTPPVDCTAIVTLTMSAQKTLSTKSVAGAYVQQGSLVRDGQISCSETRTGHVSRGVFSLVGGVAATAGLYLQSSTISGSAILAEDIYCTVELIKR